VRPASANALIISALSIGCRDHSQSKMRSRIRDHRHCGMCIFRVNVRQISIARRLRPNYIQTYTLMYLTSNSI